MENQEYWSTRLPQTWYSGKTPGTKEYWADVRDKRFYIYYPYLYKAAEFSKHTGERVLEIGVGVGTDLIEYCKHSAICYGIDITKEAIQITSDRMAQQGMESFLQVADAERIPAEDNFFDLVYSMGVIHHVKDMEKAISEIHRVLKPGGKAILWLYGKDWKYYFWFPLWHQISEGEWKKPKDLIHKYMEVEGNVPIVRMFRKKELKPLFRDFIMFKATNYRGYSTSIGNKFKKLNMAFCGVLNVLFPYNAWVVEVVK